MKTLYSSLILVTFLIFFQIEGFSQTLTLTPSNFNGYNIDCFGSSSGSINLTITGGTPPYTIRWSNDVTTEDQTGLPAGYYVVEVDDSDSLTDVVFKDIMLTQPEPLQIGEMTPYLYQNGYNISDFGSCNGSVNYDVVGGVLPYTYIWEPSQQTIKNPTNLCAHENVVIVSDANGCSTNSGIGLSEPQRDDWTMYGNYNSNPTYQFIGSVDNKDVSFRTNNIERFRIKSDGKISMSTFSGAGSKIVYADSLGNLKSLPFILPTCAGFIMTPWQQSPYHWEDVFACYRNFGIGTDNPREKLEVKGSMIVSAWDITMNNMSDYIQLKHDGGNARIENFGIGDLLINPGNSKNVKIGTEPGGGFFQTGSNTYLATNGGRVGIGTSNPFEALQIGDVFTFHSGATKIIGYNYYYDNPTNQSYRIDLNKPVSLMAFDQDGGIQFKMGNCVAGNSLINSYIESISINSRGYVGIGGPPEDGNEQDDPLLIVCGKIKAKEFELRIGWCDFVFDEDYSRMSFDELHEFLKTNKHLPYIKSGKIIESEGLKMGETMQGFVQNLEETRLDVIDLYNMIKELKVENENLRNELEQLKANR